MIKKIAAGAVLMGSSVLAANSAMATCADVSRADLLGHAKMVVADKNGGFGLPMWVSVVDETGAVCHVVNTAGSGATIGNKSWLGSRVISVQKANTANDFSLDGYSISTAILYRTVQPDNSLFGLQLSNPVDTAVAYNGDPKSYGTPKDPLVGKRPGGINVFGGGLALYKKGAKGVSKKVGAIGVSGDTSCTDHVVAWKIRAMLGLDNVPNGFTKTNFRVDGTSFDLGGKGDELVLNSDGLQDDAAGWAHPACPNTATSDIDGGAILRR
jgi:uncharacterized protein GlcG (DUF336 family)